MSTESKSSRPNLTEYESLLVGAIGGTIETSLQMPLITWKICVQEGRAYPKGIREWYRGVFINASGVAPITAVQCFANSLLQKAVLHGQTRHLTDIENLTCSAGAGALSAFIYGPVDLLVIQQQKYVASLSNTFNIINKEYGMLKVYRGLLSTMVRESIYTMGYLGVAPVVQNRLANINSYFHEHYVITSVVSAMIGGTFASLLTHPVDTAKTCVQSDLTSKKYPTATWTLKYLYTKQDGGLHVLFKGVVPRTLRLCGACFVISQVREFMLHMKNSQ